MCKGTSDVFCDEGAVLVKESRQEVLKAKQQVKGKKGPFVWSMLKDRIDLIVRVKKCINTQMLLQMSSMAPSFLGMPLSRPVPAPAPELLARTCGGG